MNDLTSILTFNNYNVEKVEFIKNNDFNNDNVKIDFKVDKETSFDKNSNIGKVTLDVNIFKDPIQNNYPFSLRILVTGIFTIDCDDDDLCQKLLNKNAVSILFPYIRALITTYTANSNVPALILPPINVNKLIDNQTNEG